MLRGFNVADCGQACFDDDSTSSSDTSSSTTACNFLNFADIFVWAPGSADIALPDDVGFRFGNASGGFLSVDVEMHYNNPDEEEGVLDDSGVRVYYTEEMRPMDMGVIQLGDPFIELENLPVSEGRSSYSFQCPGSCSEQYFKVSLYFV